MQFESTVQELRQNLDPLTPIFVLVDPMLGEPLSMGGGPTNNADPQADREAMWQRPVTRIELPERVPLTLHQHPYLVALNGVDDPLLEVTLEAAQTERAQSQEDGLEGSGAAPHHIGGWLQSSMHPPRFARGLASLLKVNTDAQTKASYFRLADRRVLALLRHVVGDARVASQFGRLQQWIYLDVQGKLSSLCSPGEDISPLRLSLAEWGTMEQGEELNRTIAQWLGEVAKSGNDQLQPEALYASVYKAVSEAGQAATKWPRRFTHTIDKTIWATLTLLHPTLRKDGAAHAQMGDPGNPDEPPEPLRYMHTQLRALLQARHDRRQPPAHASKRHSEDTHAYPK
ncbi:MAG: hypothetical protein V7606_1823 [Burkholderiales bacterium]